MQTAQEVLVCQHHAWYPRFKHCAVRAVSLEMPPAFRDFLLSDGVFLAEGSQALPPRAGAGSEDADSSSSGCGAWSEEEAGSAAGDAVRTEDLLDPALEARIQAAIEALGGKVVPKLNWSCPSDAAWMSATRSTACTNAAEVVLLLQSSDKVAHDLTRAFESCSEAPPAGPPPCTLTLRKWFAWRPHRELRCFVADHDLVAVSQRNITECFLAGPGEEEALREALLEFFEEQVEGKFPSRDFTFDVYVTTKMQVVLVDFNPVGGSTSPLLFDWAELPYPRLREPAATPEREEQERQPASAGVGQQCSPSNGVSTKRQEELPGGSDAASSCDNVSSRQGESADRGRGASTGPDGPGVVAGQEGREDGLLPLRLVREPVSLLAPGASVFGAPFDLADASEGGALQQLAERVQTLHAREE